MRKNELTFYEDPFFEGFFEPVFRHTNNNMMKTDITENDTNYEFDVELPGAKKENISLDIEDGYLTVSYHEEHNNDEKKHGKYIRRERYYGSQTRSFYVGDVDRENIDASFNNGVLNIIIPKEQPKAKEVSKIEIK